MLKSIPYGSLKCKKKQKEFSDDLSEKTDGAKQRNSEKIKKEFFLKMFEDYCKKMKRMI